MSRLRAARRAATRFQRLWLPIALLAAPLALSPAPAPAQSPPDAAAPTAPTAPAGSDEAAESLADVPSGDASLRGHVLHTDRTDAAAAGIEVVLYSLGRDGTPGSRRTTTGPDGAFRFEGISAAEGIVYLLGARYAGLPFPGERVGFAPGETERVVEIRISEPSDDRSQVEVVQSSLRVEWVGDRIAIGEVHRLKNAGKSVYHVAPEARAGRTPPLHAELPRDASDFGMPLGLVPEGAVLDGRDFRFWGPLYPGEQEISFRYSVPVPSGLVGLEKRFPSAAARVRVFGREGGPLEAVEGLAPAEIVEDEGLRFQPFERAPAPAGLSALLRLRIPETTDAPGAVSLVESQMVLEVDDVTLRAQEQHQIEVTGTATARAPEGGLVLNVPLPEGAEDIRFSGDAGALGLVRTDGGVGLTGPLAPGEHAFGLAYSLRVGADGVAFQRIFDRRLPLLRVYVADTGVAVETNRLHRRRPVRDADRTFLLLEAFEVDGDEPLEFSLRPLPPRVSSRTPALVAAVVTGLATALFLLLPLRGRESALPAEAADDAPASSARREREHVYESIRDLDHDYETGKLDAADWENLRAELRGRAVALLAEERRAEAAAPPGAAPEAGPPACKSCGAAAGPDDRFCARCGHALDPAPDASA